MVAPRTIALARDMIRYLNVMFPPPLLGCLLMSPYDSMKHPSLQALLNDFLILLTSATVI